MKKRFTTLSLLIPIFSVNSGCKAVIIVRITNKNPLSSSTSWNLARVPISVDTIFLN